MKNSFVKAWEAVCNDTQKKLKNGYYLVVVSEKLGRGK